MNCSRRFLLWLAVAPLMAAGPLCHGHPAKIPKVTPPVQTYAVIDMTGAPSNAVDRVALNDANQAAFGITTGSGYTTYTFSGGTTTHVQDMATEVVTTTADTTTTEDRSPEYHTNIIDSQGAIYGYVNSSTVRNSDQKPLSSSGDFMIYRGGAPNSIGVPPFGKDGEDTSGGINAISEGGFCGDIGGRVNGTDTGDGGFLLGQTSVVFNSSLTAADGDGGELINSTFFVPFLMNNTGAALGDLNHGGGWEFWDGQTLTDVSAYANTQDLNDQNQFVFGAAEGGLWEGGQVTTLRDTLPPLIQYQYWNIQPFSLSNQVAGVPLANADTTIHLIATADGLDVGSYGTMLYTRNSQGKWTFANIALPAGTVINDFVTINSSGVIATISNGGHALMLVPVEIRDLKDLDDPTDDVLIQPLTGPQDINPASVAWIEPHKKTQDAQPGSYDAGDDPRMPQLAVQIKGLPSSMQVQWKFDCKYTRPNGRQITEDEVKLPVNGSFKTVAGDQSWNIYQEYSSQPFFGGDVTLTYKILGSNGSVVVPETTVPFRIAGKNPDNTRARLYLDATQPDLWYGYAICKHETAEFRYQGTFYNHRSYAPKARVLC